MICSIYGRYDAPKVQPKQSLDAKWILVTDRLVDAPGWEVVVEPRPHMHPCLAAKVAKCRPDLYAPYADMTVWMDGSLQLLTDNALEEIVAEARGLVTPMAQVAHPDRDCIYEEAEFCLPIPKYADQPMLAQVEHYRSKGHRRHAGLWATGLIVRSYFGGHGRDEHRQFGDAWLREQMRWTFQDQLSEAPLLRDDQVGTLPFPLHGSGLFEWHAGHH